VVRRGFPNTYPDGNLPARLPNVISHYLTNHELLSVAMVFGFMCLSYTQSEHRWTKKR
jgi:hypothetical protein